MIPDVSTGDPTRLFCLNCARRTVAPRSVSKYDGLKSYLVFRGSFTDRVKLNLARIDGIIGDNLPMEAFRSETWWNNTSGGLHSKGWLEAGFEVSEINLKEGFVVFKKVREVHLQKRRQRSEKPFTPVPVRFTKSRIPSNTKVAKLYARVKNLERQRKALPTYRGSFTPKSKYQKRLYKTDTKPQ